MGRPVDQADAVEGVGLPAVGRHEREAVGLEDHDRRAVAEAGREALDPGAVVVAGRRAARRVLRAVAPGDVVGDQDGEPALAGGLVGDLPDALLDLLGAATREPDRLRRVDHRLDERGVARLARGLELRHLRDAAVEGRGNVEPRRGIDGRASGWGRRQDGDRRGAGQQEADREGGDDAGSHRHAILLAEEHVRALSANQPSRPDEVPGGRDRAAGAGELDVGDTAAAHGSRESALTEQWQRTKACQCRGRKAPGQAEGSAEPERAQDRDQHDRREDPQEQVPAPPDDRHARRARRAGPRPRGARLAVDADDHEHRRRRERREHRRSHQAQVEQRRRRQPLEARA